MAGYAAPGVLAEEWSHHPRVTLIGTVGDVMPLYQQHRVFIAPTRFAAGLPYKLHEAASFGLPAVTTSLLAGQLGWTDGKDILAADPADAADSRRASCGSIVTRRCGSPYVKQR